VYSINGLTGGEIADFMAVKVGDVNASAVPNQLLSGDTRDGLADLTFQIDEQEMKAGEEYTIHFKAKDFPAIQGYQFTLNFDNEAIAFVDFTAGFIDVSSENFGLSKLDKGIITSSWNDRVARTLADDDVLFSLSFKAKAPTKISEVLQINSRYTAAEAYTENAERMNLKLLFNTKTGLQEAQAFALYQNRPNPFKEASIIGFVLPEASSASLSIYDLSGRMLKVIEGDFEKGYNEVNIDGSDLGSKGVFYYQLDTPNSTATKKMIVIE